MQLQSTVALVGASARVILCSWVLCEPLRDSTVISILENGPGIEDGREQGPFSVTH